LASVSPRCGRGGTGLSLDRPHLHERSLTSDVPSFRGFYRFVTCWLKFEARQVGRSGAAGSLSTQARSRATALAPARLQFILPFFIRGATTRSLAFSVRPLPTRYPCFRNAS